MGIREIVSCVWKIGNECETDLKNALVMMNFT